MTDRYALLSLYRSLTRHKLYAVLNIGGLAVGVAVFLVLGLYVRFETSFERWLPHHDQIYLIQTELHLPGSPFNGAYPGSMAGMLEQLRQDFPRLTGTRIRGGAGAGSVMRDGVAQRENVAQVDPSLFDVFDLPMVKGDGRRALADPSAALVSRSAARKYFGSADPIGQTMTIGFDGPQLFRVAGVFEDLPANSDLRAAILTPIPRTPPPMRWDWYRWGAIGVTTFVRFPSRAAADGFAARLPAFLKRHATQGLGPDPNAILSLPLLPLTDLHLQPPGAESASRVATLVTLAIVGVLTLLIAIVNYVNLATARAGLRAREVAMRKVVGASRAALVAHFLGEALLASTLATLGGLILAELALPFVNANAGLSLTMPYAVLVPALVALAIGIGLVAGFYPAMLLSRFPAAAVLASARSPGGGQAGGRLREMLVVVQFGLAIALLTGTIVLLEQTRHLRQVDLGFRRDGLIAVPSFAADDLAPQQRQALLAAVRALPGVVAVATADAAAGGGNPGNGDDAGGGEGGAGIDIVAMPGHPGPGLTMLRFNVGPDFFRVYGPRLLAGRLLDDAHRRDDATDWTKGKDGFNVVIDRAAATALGFRSAQAAVGRTIGGNQPRTIVGVIDPMRFFSPRSPRQPSVYYYFPAIPPRATATIRFQGDPRTVLAAVGDAWRRIAPQVPVIADPVTRRLANFYAADDRTARLLGVAALLAVAIACIGLWGLAAFNAARRMHEIGIRKVLGASSTDIARLLVGQFLRPVLVANLIAWPLAFTGLRLWLAGFSDRIALSPLHFLAASALALLIAIATILVQALRASRAAPGWALRHD
ncbi:ABC transporter permease [Sphingomonas abaci]|uniref:Putative ABC transport system permease protein n=1 Tax=Sphingomonas abaci TaxID=237611 RepID=A0A7W7ALV5_9SPHN|nr:ABC transporter permease [Sphingomonas abaci]MBB4619301.1 putative ABC transport system permease protein [Sphingomonas abaci]